MRLWSELNDSSLLYRARHWLRDGGILYLFDTFFWAVAACVVSGLLAAYLMTMFVRTILDRKASPQKSVSHVIDHRKDGTGQAGVVPRLHFDLQPKEPHR